MRETTSTSMVFTVGTKLGLSGEVSEMKGLASRAMVGEDMGGPSKGRLVVESLSMELVIRECTASL